MATTAQAQPFSMQFNRIHVRGNVRPLDVEHVHALAGSIRLQGVLGPVLVTPATGETAAGGWEFELVAGCHRVAAAALSDGDPGRRATRRNDRQRPHDRKYRSQKSCTS